MAETRPLRSRLLKGAAWTIGGAIVARAGGVVGGMVVARELGSEEYGGLVTLQSTLAMGEVIAGLALATASSRFIAQNRGVDPQRASRIAGAVVFLVTVSSILFATCLAIAAPLIATRVFAAPTLTEPLRFMAIVLVLTTISGALRGILAGLELFRASGQLMALAGVLNLPATIVGAKLAGLVGVLWGTATVLLVTTSVGFWAAYVGARRQGLAPTMEGSGAEIRSLLAFSFPVLVVGMLVAPVNWACGAIIVAQDDGLHQIALWGVSTQWQIAILFVPQNLGAVALPLLSSLVGQRSKEGFRRTVFLNTLAAFVLAVVAAVAVAAGGEVLLAQYGPGFRSGLPVLRLMCLVSVVVASCNGIGYGLMSEGRTWLYFGMNALRASVFICLAWVLRRQGALGLAYASVASYALYASVLAAYAWLRFGPASTRRV